MPAVSVGTSAVELSGSAGQEVILQNLHASQQIYFGYTDGVTTATGVRVDANGGTVKVRPQTNLFVIASGASTDLRWDRVG